MKSRQIAFIPLLSEKRHDLGYDPSEADHDIWMRQASMSNGCTYYEYVLYYAGDDLFISDHAINTMKGIYEIFQHEYDKMKEPDVYLGAATSKMNNATDKYCWAMSSDRYCDASVTNVTEVLGTSKIRLPSKCA